MSLGDLVTIGSSNSFEAKQLKITVTCNKMTLSIKFKYHDRLFNSRYNMVIMMLIFEYHIGKQNFHFNAIEQYDISSQY